MDDRIPSQEEYSAGSASHLDTSVTAHVVNAYRPLHRAFMITTMAYYAFVTAAHFPDESGLDLLVLAGLSSITAICAFLVWRTVAGRDISVTRIELLNGCVHLLMLLNVLAYQFVHYEPAKLVYFPLLAVAFALSAVSQRSAVVSVLAALAAMLLVVWLRDPGSLGPYVFITIATAVTCIGLSSFLRGVIEREIGARITSETAQHETHRMSEANARFANADFLTELPNRRQFMQALSDLTATETGGAAAILDLDGFKGINDAFGHGAGDRVLVEVARRLATGRPAGTVVARIGGDEFGLLYKGDIDVSALIADTAAILGLCRAPFHLDTTISRLGGSLGVATVLPGDTADSVLDRADYAVYEAKHKRKGRAVFFSTEHEERIQRVRLTERSMLKADLEQEITAVFQPIINAQTGATIGYEALARWQSPELGEVSPGAFIPIAERLGLEPTITRCMVRHALDLAARLPDKQRVSVNLSVHDLASTDAMRMLSNILSADPVKPCRVDFEVTESAVMRDIGEAIEALLVLLAHGSRISLDDFGTGHSSLSRVHMLPLDRIKIDRSFITDIATNRASRAIVKTTIDLCQNLGVSCVVEGTETLEQVNAVRALGATLFQGYYFGRPVAASMVQLDDNKAASSAA